MSLAERLIEHLGGSSRSFALADGDILVREGDEADNVYFIVSGVLEATNAKPQGDIVVGTITATDAGSGVATGDRWYTTSGSSGTPISLSQPVTSEGITQVTGVARDRVGNVGSSEMLKVWIDKTDPTPSLSLSTNEITVGGSVEATFSCEDVDGIDPSGIETCVITSTAAIDDTSTPPGTVVLSAPSTNSIGTYSVTVTATDRADNSDSVTRDFGVGYRICLDYDGSQAKNVGSNYTIKLRLCDAGGNDLSSRRLTLRAVALNPGNIPPGVNDSGKANRDAFEFRYSNSGYTYNLDTSGVPAGDWTLDFEVVGDASGLTYSAPFALR